MDAAYLKLLEKDYGMEVLAIFKQRGNYIVQTPSGTKELKKNTSDKKRIFFEHDARNHLADSGFPAETFIPTSENLPFSLMEDTCYVLTEYFPSSSADLSASSMLFKGAEILASFHQKAKGLSSEYEVVSAGNLISFYEKRIREMKKIRSKISSFTSPSKVDILIKENYSYYFDRAASALEILKNSEYKNFSEKAFKEKHFVHGSFKRDSIRISDKDGSFLISNFSKCAIDIQLSDLSEYIRRYIKDPDSSFSVIENILDSYGKINHLSDSDIKILTAMLTYPYKFMKLLNEHYNKRRVYVSDAVCGRFLKCINRIPRENTILNQMNSLL